MVCCAETHGLQDRNLTASSEWRQAIQQVDSAVLGHLRNEVAGGFDEEQFGNRIGFANLKLYVLLLVRLRPGYN